MLQVKKIIFKILLIISVNNLNGQTKEADLQVFCPIKFIDNFCWGVSESPLTKCALNISSDFLFKLKKHSLNKISSKRYDTSSLLKKNKHPKPKITDQLSIFKIQKGKKFEQKKYLIHFSQQNRLEKALV